MSVWQHGILMSRPTGVDCPLALEMSREVARCFPRNVRCVMEQRATAALGDPLVGGEGTLASTKPVKTVGSYWPYATTLFDYIRRAMPYDHPESLSADEVYAVTAFVLNLNGIAPENARLDAHNLPKIRMPNRNGFVSTLPPTRR